MKARHLAWIVAVGLVCAPAQAGALLEGMPNRSLRQHSEERRQSSRPTKWWIEAKERAELGITDQQSARIEAIFRSTVDGPEGQRARYMLLRKLEPALAQLIKDGTADPSVVEREVERVENLWAQVRKTRIVMFYRMHRELTPEQRTKLKAMEERREKEHREAERRKSTDTDGRR